MDEKTKNWIDSQTYEALLERWRFAPVGDKMFAGETGEYYSKVLATRRRENETRHVAASKTIGWERS